MQKSTYDIVLDAATEAAIDGIRLVRAGKIRSLSGLEEFTKNRLEGILDAFMPTLSSEAATLVAPATQQAIDAMKPAIYQALQDWTPSFAAIVGGMAGLAILLGVWVTNKQIAGKRR